MSGSNGKISVLVVDDSAVVRKLVSEALSAESDLRVTGTAPNGRVALEKLELLRPDLVLLDLEMPEMDGLTTLKMLRQRWRELPVVVFSSQTQRGATSTLDALAAGANDYLLKPSGVANLNAALEMVRRALAGKIRALVRRRELRVSEIAPRPAPVPSLPPLARISSAPIAAVAIGISAGGPQALTAVIPKLPADLGVPLLLVQHMPATFITLLTERLAAASPLRVLPARDRAQLEPGTLYVAPGDCHMLVGSYGRRPAILLDDGPPENGCRPAVDPLFRSASRVYGSGLLAVVMTGMGSDGTRGAAEVRERGGRVWAQDQASSTIWGMAGSIVKAGLAERTFKLDDLPRDLAHALKRHASHEPSLPPDGAPRS